jgi:hypothetical protein
MAKFYPALTPELRDFITRQHLFFVATAPREGRVNVSPKGLDSLRILTDNRVAYIDHTGSSNETAAHVLDNGRITLMFCSFAADPLILRLYGEGVSVQPAHREWAQPHVAAGRRYTNTWGSATPCRAGPTKKARKECAPIATKKTGSASTAYRPDWRIEMIRIGIALLLSLLLAACGDEPKPYKPPVPQAGKSDPLGAPLFHEQREALDKAKEAGQMLEQAAKLREEAAQAAGRQ